VSALAREFGLSRTTVYRELESSEPRHYGPRHRLSALTAAQLAAFQGTDVYNERQNSTLNASYALTNEWNVKFNYKHIDRSGAKLIGGGTDTTNMTDLGGFSFAGQGSGLKINPTKDRTELITLQLNWVGDKAYATLEYFGSLYHDDYRGLSFENPFVTGAPATGDLSPLGLPLNTMSTPPSNMLNQLNLTGGYFFSKATRLTGGLSLGLNTQNSSYDGTYTPGTVTGLPVSSLHGRVINTHADARLTHQFSPALNLNTGFRFDQRNNVTAVNQYEFTHLGGGTGNRPVNTPESYRRTVFDAALDYRINKNQKLHFGYGYDHMQRWCHNDAANNAQGVPPAADAGYYVNASCVQVPRSTDNSLNAAYRLALSDAVNLKADYTYADRDATVNASFYNPMQAFNQGFENYGWLAFFQAPRREHTLKLRTGWQITNQFDVGLTGTYTYDNYYDSAMGVQNGHAGNINLDATYQMSSDASIGSYIGWQRRSRYLLSASNRSATTPDPLLLWNNELHDDDFSFGVNAKQKFLHGKFQLTEDLSYDYGKSRYNTGLITTAEAVGNSGPVPPIKNQTIQFRVTGSYQFSKTSRINVGYAFQRLISNDYLNNGYMYGYTPSTMIPANMQSSSYKNHVFFVTYRYTF
jgi:MtrB/PioB family decaheme-associated outer membrane protein